LFTLLSCSEFVFIFIYIDFVIASRIFTPPGQISGWHMESTLWLSPCKRRIRLRTADGKVRPTGIIFRPQVKYIDFVTLPHRNPMFSLGPVMLAGVDESWPP